jgi:PAS domain S-box-containing protein
MHWSNRIKLTTVGVIASFTNVIVIGYFLFQSFEKNNNNEQSVSKSYDVLATSRQLQSIIKDAETSQRGYILTGKTKYLELLNNSYKLKDSLSTRLFDLISNNPNQIEEITNINHHIKQKYEHINKTLSIRKDKGNEAAISFINKDKGKNIMDSIREDFANLDKKENAILTNRHEELQRSNEKIKNILIIGIWTVIIIFLVAFSSIYNQLRRIRKKEEQLYISNEWYNQTLISMGDAVITTDTNGIITTLNKAATELTGWTNEEAKGKNIDLIVKLIDLKTGYKVINPIFNSLYKNNTIISNESTVLIKKNGEKIFIEDSGAPINDKKGNIIGAVQIFRNVTDRRKAEEERDMVYTISADMIAIAGNDGFFKKINPAFKNILGFEEQEFLSKSFFDFIHEEDVEMCKKEYQKVIAGQPTINFNTRFICQNGSYKWLEWNVIPLNGVLYANARDITERHVATQKIEAARIKFYKILESNPVAIAITDINTRKFTYVNEAFCLLSGYNRETLIGQNSRNFEMISEETILKTIKEIDENKGFAKNIDAKFKTKDNNQIDVIFYSEVLEIDGIQNYLTSIVDITPRKQLEEKIIQLNQSLERKVEERTSELENQKKFTDGILSKIPTEIAVYDSNHNYLFVNPAGVDKQEIREWLIGKNDFDYCQLNGTNYELAEKKRLAFEKLKEYEDAEWIDKIQQPNGSFKYMLRILHPIEGNDKYILTGYDVTDLKLAEETKEDYINNLEQMIFMTSHKVRVPVSNIVGLGKLLEDPLTQEEQVEVISHVRGSIEALDNFTRELTYFLHDLKKKTGR